MPLMTIAFTPLGIRHRARRTTYVPDRQRRGPIVGFYTDGRDWAQRTLTPTYAGLFDRTMDR